MAISPMSSLLESTKQPDLSPQQKTLSPTPQNHTSLEITEKQTVSEFLKEKFPSISSEELEIYNSARLKLKNVENRVCLSRPTINLKYKDALGMTNLERMKNGLSPINPKDGLPYELHHVGQKKTAPLAELTHSEHMSPKTNKILHPVRSGSEVDHGYSWRNIRENYWKARSGIEIHHI